MRHPVWGEAGWFDSLGSSRLVLKVGPACRCLPLRLRTACQVFACRQEQAPERPLAAKVGGGIGDQGSRTNDQGNDGDDGPTSILKGDGFLQKSSRWDGLSKNYLRLWNFHKFPLQKEGNHTWKTQTQQKQLPFWKNNVFCRWWIANVSCWWQRIRKMWWRNWNPRPGKVSRWNFFKPNQWNQIFLCGIFLGNTFLNVCGECFLWGIFCFR